MERSQMNRCQNRSKKLGKIMSARTFLVIICLFLFTFMCNFTTCFATNVQVQMNGKIIDFTDANGNKVEAQIINSRTMVPLRKIFEVLGCEIEWNGEEQEVTAKKEGKEIRLQVGNLVAWCKENGVERQISLDSAPVIVQNRTLVPLRFVAESLDKQVGWDNQEKTAIIIDYDSFVNQIQQANPALCQILKDDKSNYTFSIEKIYTDVSDASNSSNAKLSGTIEMVENEKKVSLSFDGTDELMQEIKEEGWSEISYTVKEENGSMKVQTSNEVFAKMLKMASSKEEDGKFHFKKGTPKDRFGRSNCNYFCYWARTD